MSCKDVLQTPIKRIAFFTVTERHKPQYVYIEALYDRERDKALWFHFRLHHSSHGICVFLRVGIFSSILLWLMACCSLELELIQLFYDTSKPTKLNTPLKWV